MSQKIFISDYMMTIILILFPILSAGTWNVCPLGEIVLGNRIAKTPTSLVWSASFLSELENVCNSSSFTEKREISQSTAYQEECEETSSQTESEYSDGSIYLVDETWSDSSDEGEVDDSANRLAIKYMTNCARLIQGSPRDDGSRLLHEFKVLSLFNSSGITPHVYYLSEPQSIGSLDFSNSGKVGDVLARWTIKEPQFRWEICEERAQFRYQIMDKVGSDLLTYFIGDCGVVKLPTRDNLRSALLKTAKSVRLLKSFHDLGWVHGDIHFGNIAFIREDNFDELVLIDLEKSAPILSPPSPVHELNKYLLSPWQLEGGHPLAPRDDLVRLIHSLAYILDPESLEDLVNVNIEELIRKKRNEPVFNHFVLTSRFALDEGMRIPEQLEALNRFVLDQSADIGPIHYDAIIEALYSIAHLLL